MQAIQSPAQQETKRELGGQHAEVIELNNKNR
jgi:hypothetical protein